jgi:hypothetical protein
MAKTKPPKARYKAGDWVTFRYGLRDVLARILEPRGPIGVRQRHLYRIEIPGESAEPDSFELPEEELAPAEPPVEVAIVANGNGSMKGHATVAGDKNLKRFVAELVRKYKLDHPDEKDDLRASPPSWFSTSGHVFVSVGRSIYRIRNNRVEEELRKTDFPAAAE